MTSALAIVALVALTPLLLALAFLVGALATIFLQVLVLKQKKPDPELAAVGGCLTSLGAVVYILAVAL